MEEGEREIEIQKQKGKDGYKSKDKLHDHEMTTKQDTERTHSVTEEELKGG